MPRRWQIKYPTPTEAFALEKQSTVVMDSGPSAFRLIPVQAHGQRRRCESWAASMHGAPWSVGSREIERQPRL
jgi:hypothetical protein